MQVFTPRTGAIFEFGGKRVRWVAGQTHIEEGAPILRGRELMVRPIEIHFPAPAAKAAKKPEPAA